jgi:predicted dithiol-disulfide oxidoreductase (DUF899 family)
MDDPQVVSREEWLNARRQLLAKEKELTRQRDALNAERRRLPMTEIGKQYAFDGKDGTASLPGLFEGRDQLLIYHFMFDPGWDEGCPSCSLLADNIGHLAHLHARGTTLALVSRAPLAKIEPFRQRMGWAIPWYSSHGTDFNYDLHVTLDQAVAPVEYNYRGLDELGPDWQGWSGEMHGISAFLRREDRVYHTYSSYARGTDMVVGTYHWLDLTARGRQEDWEQPPGRSDGPLMGWLRHHDRYGAPGHPSSPNSTGPRHGIP